jgi:hypothetical protein
MFAFDISGLALEVAPPDTGRVRLVAVTSGLLEARPHEIGADFPDRVARGVWLRACSGGDGNDDAQAYLNDVFDALQDPSDGRGDGGELRVAAALLSGARKSEKLAAAFEVLGPDALDLNGVARLLRAALASIAFATDATDISQAINREAASLAEDVCANADDQNEITFDDFGNWYNSRGFELAPWLELLDLTKWPVDGRGELQDESDEEEDDEEETASRAVVAFEVATDDGTTQDDDGQVLVLRAAFSLQAVGRLRDLVMGSGLGDCDASVLCGHAARAATAAGRLDRRAFASVIAAFAPDEASAERHAPFLHYLYGAFVRDEQLGADAAEVAAGLSLLCAGSKSSKLAVAWELFADGDKWDGALSRRGLWRYVRSFLATLLAVASLPDGAAGDAAVAECAVDVADDADDAAVALAAAVFADAGGDDLVAFDDFADWYTDGGYKVASWLELLDLSKWVL